MYWPNPKEPEVNDQGMHLKHYKLNTIFVKIDTWGSNIYFIDNVVGPDMMMKRRL